MNHKSTSHLLVLFVLVLFVTTGVSAGKQHCIDQYFSPVPGSLSWGHVSLVCPEGTVVREIQFASFGTPTGSCGHFQHGICQGNATYILQDIQNACVNKTDCQIEVDKQYLDPSTICPLSLYPQQKLAVEWSCETATLIGSSSTRKEPLGTWVIVVPSVIGIWLVVSTILFALKKHSLCVFAKKRRLRGDTEQKLISLDDLSDMNESDVEDGQQKLQISKQLQNQILTYSDDKLPSWDNDDVILYTNRELRQLAKDDRIPIHLSQGEVAESNRKPNALKSTLLRSSSSVTDQFVDTFRQQAKDKSKQQANESPRIPIMTPMTSSMSSHGLPPVIQVPNSMKSLRSTSVHPDVHQRRVTSHLPNRLPPIA